MPSLTAERVQDILSAHAPLYRRRSPVYQTVMLSSLAEIWQAPHDRVLDVGGGTGVIAQAIQTLLPAREVVTIDVVDRFFSTLTVETKVYDGRTLPFASDSFDAATINNVLHHVPIDVRKPLLGEIARVVSGPIYIKDHLPSSRVDHVRLSALDAIGNIPFGGQIDADYLSMDEWHALARSIARRIGAIAGGEYRAAPMRWLFPNRLEVSFRLDPQ